MGQKVPSSEFYSGPFIRILPTPQRRLHVDSIYSDSSSDANIQALKQYDILSVSASD